MLGLALAVQLPGSVPFHMLDSYAYTGAATVKASSLNVRSGAGTGYQAVGRLAAGASIQILGEQTGTDGNTWYQIRFSGTGGGAADGDMCQPHTFAFLCRIPQMQHLRQS